MTTCDDCGCKVASDADRLPGIVPGSRVCLSCYCYLGCEGGRGRTAREVAQDGMALIVWAGFAVLLAAAFAVYLVLS